MDLHWAVSDGEVTLVGKDEAGVPSSHLVPRAASVLDALNHALDEQSVPKVYLDGIHYLQIESTPNGCAISLRRDTNLFGKVRFPSVISALEFVLNGYDTILSHSGR